MAFIAPTLAAAARPASGRRCACRWRRPAACAAAAGDAAARPLISTEAGAVWLAAPVAVRGRVQRGLGRGSRKLGTPTANLPGALLAGVSATARDGVYFGFGAVPALGGAPVGMVANVGRNATFGDVPARVLEAYLMDDALADEFYGEEMRLCIVGFLRAEVKFDGVGALAANIRNDVAVARALLGTPRAAPFARHHSLQA
jgi:riboflavin kinase